MKLNHTTLAAVLMTVFAASAAFAQNTSGGQSPSREAVRSEAISSHKDGTMVHGEAAPKSKEFKSKKSRAEVKAEAISSHKDGTMVHGEAAPKSKEFKSTKSRKEVRGEAISSHKDGTMVHGEATPVTPPTK
jgi:hypothetical protein